MPNADASFFSPSRTRSGCHALNFHDAWIVMLKSFRVTCSSSPSIFAPCSNKNPVTRATTPVLSSPITVMVAICFMV